jgi:hypothetical protein
MEFARTVSEDRKPGCSQAVLPGPSGPLVQKQQWNNVGGC